MTKKNNWGNMDFTQIMMQQAQKSLDTPAYCRYCGKDVKQPSEASRQSDSGDYANDWELRNSAHSSCYEKNNYGGRR
jgi:hypothetical protein